MFNRIVLNVYLVGELLIMLYMTPLQTLSCNIFNDLIYWKFFVNSTSYY